MGYFIHSLRKGTMAIMNQEKSDRILGKIQWSAIIAMVLTLLLIGMVCIMARNSIALDKRNAETISYYQRTKTTPVPASIDFTGLTSKQSTCTKEGALIPCGGIYADITGTIANNSDTRFKKVLLITAKDADSSKNYCFATVDIPAHQSSSVKHYYCVIESKNFHINNRNIRIIPTDNQQYERFDTMYNDSLNDGIAVMMH